MLTELQVQPAGLAAASAAVARLDALFQAGFAGGRHAEALASLGRIFAGTPLAVSLMPGIAALEHGMFQPDHVTPIAAARAALQGAMYDTLRQQAARALGRALEPEAPVAISEVERLPLLDSVRHWLAELAITGFARLDANVIMPFFTPLAQLRRERRLASLALLLTGFADELLASVPVAPGASLPLTRWCDMWSTAMIAAAGVAAPPAVQPVSGTLLPLGAELRERAQLASWVVYGLLEHAEGATWVRLAGSRFKVHAIRGTETWLLFPEVAPLLEAIAQDHAIAIHDMPLTPDGSLLWEAGRAQPAEGCKLLDRAARWLAPQAAEQVVIRPLPPLDRHPIQLAEPVVFAGYTLQPDRLVFADQVSLPFDARWDPEAGPSTSDLGKSTIVAGLLRYDAGRWAFQPLAAAGRSGKLAFAGQAAARLFKKPPKVSTVAILEERASRLLRK